MKKLTLLIALILMGMITYAQQPAKNDVILKTNGDELAGKVQSINDSAIVFSYAGETLTYSIKKTEILKITYASGRIEFFNRNAGQPSGSSAGQQQKPAANPNLESHHNKVAFLPFTFVKDGQAADDAVGDQVQQEAYNFLSKHAGMFTILDPRTTNALLIKAGITDQNIKGYTMEDLCNILGVEYVISGVVNQNKTTQTVTSNTYGQVKTKDDDDKKDKKYNSSTYGTAQQNYQTSLDLGIYNDKGVTVYSQQRNSFWNTQDAYKNTLEYLLKRTPLYTK
ncbi:hypothetical protein [Pseudobacter ginsenosidimutans]|uniref:Curli production assembly/transport component CsgG n=1 Tax=Pseudobacter ginsenosidimutans TaxID=661488 RepID=A0A4Q7MNM6_9BACT|nr:hypothetical protein [Pseudobacter ginsenosidimutans]QEC45762.1 hypothetical protein FSB84_30235 [Pseudobacter ginsenosidimutans]RZS69293.1 hypothetical protein EV199_5130 [Pseudobacter ginsenosidimutans]